LCWWQVDLTGYLIRTLRLLGLAWDIKVPPASQLQQARNQA
jgi:fatty-acid desaturase